VFENIHVFIEREGERGQIHIYRKNSNIKNEPFLAKSVLK
jgi:hypothetical protein